MDEDYYALSKLARTVFGTNDLDHRRDGGAPWLVEEIVAARATREESVTYDDVERAKVILVAGLDAEQEVPILHLRLRKAARRGARIFVLHPRRTRLWDVAEHILCRPGEEQEIVAPAATRTSPRRSAAAGADGVMLAGPRLADGGHRHGASRSWRGSTGARFAYVTRRANDRGALVAGVHPSLLPGGRRFGVAEERTEVETLWGPIIVGDEGRNWRGILEACAEREIDVLFLVGVDPLRDFPDAALARGRCRTWIAWSCSRSSWTRWSRSRTRSCRPPPFLEKDGHVTTWEGRSQRLRPIRGRGRHRPAGLGDLREPGAGRGRRPGLRDAR